MRKAKLAFTPGAVSLTAALLAAGAGIGACGEATVVEEEAARDAIAQEIQAAGGTLTLENPRSGESERLTFDHLHESVEVSEGGRYVVCADFLADDGTVWDLDYYVNRNGDDYHVQDTVVHMIGEEEVISDAERERLDSRSGAAG